MLGLGIDQDTLALPLPLVLFLISCSAILQDDITCLVVGIYVAAGNVSFLPAVAACFVGTLLGDLLWFFVGRICGSACLTRAPVKWVVTAQHLQRAREFLEKHGPTAIALTRFVPLIRTPVQIIAGALSPRAAPLMLYFVLAALVYAPLLVIGSALLGNAVDIYSLYEKYGHSALLAVGLLVWLLLVGTRLALRQRT